MTAFFDWLKMLISSIGISPTQLLGGIVLWILAYVLLREDGRRFWFVIGTIAVAAAAAIKYG